VGAAAVGAACVDGIGCVGAVAVVGAALAGAWLVGPACPVGTGCPVNVGLRGGGGAGGRCASPFGAFAASPSTCASALLGARGFAIGGGGGLCLRSVVSSGAADVMMSSSVLGPRSATWWSCFGFAGSSTGKSSAHGSRMGARCFFFGAFARGSAATVARAPAEATGDAVEAGGGATAFTATGATEAGGGVFPLCTCGVGGVIASAASTPG